MDQDAPKVVRGVYFLQMAEFVKIGVSSDIAKRVNDLRTSVPLPISILGAIPGATRSVERALHQRFALHRRNGEWFDATPEILAEAQLWAEHVMTITRPPRPKVAPGAHSRRGSGVSYLDLGDGQGLYVSSGEWPVQWLTRCVRRASR